MIAGRGRPKGDRSGQLIAPSYSEEKAPKTRDIRAKAAGTNRTYIDNIKSLISQEAIDALNFEEISYVDAQNRNQPAYLLDFDATMTLITALNFEASEYKDAEGDIKKLHRSGIYQPTQL